MANVQFSGTSLVGDTIDFTNLTRKQAIAAGGELYTEGKLTAQQVGYLQGFSLDSAPIDSSSAPSPEYGLNSTVKRNYESIIQQDLAFNQSLGSSQAKEVAADQNLLKVLSPYFRNLGQAGQSGNVSFLA